MSISNELIRPNSTFPLNHSFNQKDEKTYKFSGDQDATGKGLAGNSPSPGLRIGF